MVNTRLSCYTVEWTLHPYRVSQTEALMSDIHPLPDGWTITEIRDKEMNKLPGGHGRIGRSVPTAYLNGDKVDATDAQLRKSWKVLLRYDPPDGGKPKFRTLIRATSRRKIAIGIDTIIAKSSPV